MLQTFNQENGSVGNEAEKRVVGAGVDETKVDGRKKEEGMRQKLEKNQWRWKVQNGRIFKFEKPNVY